MKKRLLFIMTLIIALTGSYICTTNATSDSISKLPDIAARPHNIIVSEGETIRIEAIVIGTPKPEVRWYKDNYAINEDERTTISYGDERATLIIKNAKTSDSGKYIIKAENAVGMAQATCEVYVEPKRLNNIARN